MIHTWYLRVVFLVLVFTAQLLIFITSATALFFFLSPLIISWPFRGAWPRNQNVWTNPFVYHWSQLLPVYHWSDKGGANTFSLGCVWEEVGHQEEIGECERSTGGAGSINGNHLKSTLQEPHTHTWMTCRITTPVCHCVALYFCWYRYYSAQNTVSSTSWMSVLGQLWTLL